MSERDVIVSAWAYDEAAFKALVEELRKPYPNTLRVYERVLMVNDAVPRGAVTEVQAALERVRERMPGHGALKVVVIPEEGSPMTFRSDRNGLFSHGDLGGQAWVEV